MKAFRSYKWIAFFLGIIVYSVLQQLHAQNDSLAMDQEGIYPGYVITNSDDTLRGYIQYESVSANQLEVTYYSSMNLEETHHTYKPGDIKGYKLLSYTFVSVPFSGKYCSRKKTFMHRAIDGPITLFKWYYIEKQQYFEDNDIYEYNPDASYELAYQVQLFAQKFGENPVNLNSTKFEMRFRIAMSKYVLECLELAKKIGNKEKRYTHDYIEKIIREYNACDLK
jgi:hypothetical protein